MPSPTDLLLDHLTADQPQAVARLRDFLAIPSVSTDPAYREHVQRGAAWVADYCRDLGLAVEVIPTAGHPVVLASTRPEQVTPPAGTATPAKVLFYGHYDVQPADPLSLWTTPPFEPAIRDGAIVARGASDDKGQVLCFLEALRAWKKVHGTFPLHVTVMIEGEEEMGSVHLRPVIEARKAALAQHTVVIVSDTAMWDSDQGPRPAITYGMRGLVYFDVKLHGPARDLHSGVYGNTIANPATMLTGVLGRLFDAQHRVTIPGFYDDVLPVSAAERQAWSDLAFDEARFVEAIGLKQGFGEAGYPLLERRWARPACDINGLYGGYMGEGAKTVIPSFAGAKVSFRLAPNQQGDVVAKQFEAWLAGQDVHGCRWDITFMGACDPVMVSRDSPAMRAAFRAIEQVAGQAPVLIRDGATVPVVGDFKKMLGLDSLLIGFGLNDDRIHSPNEKFDLANFYLGCKTHALVLAELAKG